MNLYVPLIQLHLMVYLVYLIIPPISYSIMVSIILKQIPGILLYYCKISVAVLKDNSSIH